MSTDNNCIFCDNKCNLSQTPNHHRLNTYRCSYCGEYILPKNFPLSAWSRESREPNKFKIACILNERRLKGLSGIVLSDKTDKENKVCECPQISIKAILDEFPKKASDFRNRTLLNLSRLPNHPFGVIRLNLIPNQDCLHFFMQDIQECHAFLHELASQSLIRFNEVERRPQLDVFFLTGNFWDVTENLQQTAIDSKQVFVAMCFDSSMDEYYKEGIKPAIEEAGYTPIKIDLQDFNGKICDEIIVEIKRSKFIIADFCKHRGGVYFEAGYAMGQGKPVIFTASKAELKKAHFDTRQYNHIEYDTPEDLRKKLYNRICATIV